jgi:hypothetical protein
MVGVELVEMMTMMMLIGTETFVFLGTESVVFLKVP